MYECLSGPLVRLTHGLRGTRPARPTLRRWLMYNIYQPYLIFIMDGEAERHVWLTLFFCAGFIFSRKSRQPTRPSQIHNPYQCQIV